MDLVAAPDPQSARARDAVAHQEEVRDRLRNGSPIVADGTLPEGEADHDEALAVAIPGAPAHTNTPRKVTLEAFDFEQVLRFVMSKIKPEELFSRMIANTKAEESIKLKIAGLVLNWKVVMAHVQENQVGFFADRGHSFPELEVGMPYALEVGGQTYPVKFIGAFYPSPDFRFALMSFLRVHENA